MPGRLFNIKQSSPNHESSEKPSKGGLNRFQSSLSFIVVGLMVLLAIIPVALVSAGNYLRTRAFLQEQTNWQLQNFVQSQSSQLLEISNQGQLFITRMLDKGAIQDALNG